MHAFAHERGLTDVPQPLDKARTKLGQAATRGCDVVPALPNGYGCTPTSPHRVLHMQGVIHDWARRGNLPKGPQHCTQTSNHLRSQSGKQRMWRGSRATHASCGCHNVRYRVKDVPGVTQTLAGGAHPDNARNPLTHTKKRNYARMGQKASVGSGWPHPHRETSRRRRCASSWY